MSASAPTVDELIALLRATALPTVLVEGDQDMAVVRWIEDTLGTRVANMLACGGRETLLAVFRRRHELNSPVAFLADLDMFVVSGVPIALAEIIWSDGYSLENDVLVAGWSVLAPLLSQSEALTFDALVRALSTWFAGAVEEHWSGRPAICSTHLNQLIPMGSTGLHPAYARTSTSADTIAFVYASHSRIVRGKQLFQALERVLNAPGRSARHRYEGLVEMALKLPTTTPLQAILARILVTLHP